MEIKKIKGNTYYIDAPTNIGVYSFKNKNCLLVDTGSDNSHAKKADEILLSFGLHPKYIINTHCHIDHCGGNHYFKTNYTGSQFYTSHNEKIFIENPKLLFSLLSSSAPISFFDKIFKPVNIDFVLEYGVNKINDEKFNILSLKGHSLEQIGVITPDKVCFLGDSVFSETVIDKYSLPYLFDVQEELDTLNYLKDIDCDYFLLSHIDKVLDRDEFQILLNKNIENIQKYIEQIKDLVEQAVSREDLLENLAVLNEINMGYRQYFLNFSSISAFVKYLLDQKMINGSVEDGKLYFFKNPQV